MTVDALKTIFDDPNLSDDEKAKQAKAILDAAKAEAQKDKSGNPSLLSLFTAQSPAAKDPVQVMREVLGDDNYDDDEKKLLFFMSRERFQNRRRMAYIALWVLVATTLFLAIGWMYDVANHDATLATCLSAPENLPDNMITQERQVAIAAVVEDGCTEFPFSQVLQQNEYLLSWLGTFFTSVIALYFGAASFRPTS